MLSSAVRDSISNPDTQKNIWNKRARTQRGMARTCKRAHTQGQVTPHTRRGKCVREQTGGKCAHIGAKKTTHAGGKRAHTYTGGKRAYMQAASARTHTGVKRVYTHRGKGHAHTGASARTHRGKQTRAHTGTSTHTPQGRARAHTGGNNRTHRGQARAHRGKQVSAHSGGKQASAHTQRASAQAHTYRGQTRAHTNTVTQETHNQRRQTSKLTPSRLIRHVKKIFALVVVVDVVVKSFVVLKPIIQSLVNNDHCFCILQNMFKCFYHTIFLCNSKNQQCSVV